MNRRELAKNGLLGLIGALVGKLPNRGSDRISLTCDTHSGNLTYLVTFPAGSVNTWGGWDFQKDGSDYSLSDGTEIEHGTC